MMYYVYLIASLVGDLFITLENNLLETAKDLWRSILIYPLLFLICVIFHIVIICTVSLFAERSTERRSLNSIYRWLTLETIDLYLHIMRMNLHVSGEEIIPENRRFFFVGNHISIFDPMIAMLFFRDKELSFISKKENIQIPFGGRLMLASGVLPLDRENPRNAVYTIREAASRIKDDFCSIGIYPEGKCNKTDELLLPFHSGSFKIAEKSKAPIVVATIRNTENMHKRFLFTSTDVYLDIIKVIEPDEYVQLRTNEISELVWHEMYSHLSNKLCPEAETSAEIA